MMYCKMEHVLFDMQDLLLNEKLKVTQLFLGIVKMQFLRSALIRTYDIKYSNVKLYRTKFTLKITYHVSQLHLCTLKTGLSIYFNDWHRVCIREKTSTTSYHDVY